MTDYKLTYFNIKGRAEVIRYMFVHAGTAYEDKRVENDEWSTIKDDAKEVPLGELPVLTVDGEPFPQSQAISRYIADQLGFYPKNPLNRFRTDVVQETVREMVAYTRPVFDEPDEGRKVVLTTKLAEEGLPKILKKLEILLQRNNDGNGWFVGERVTLADFAAFHMFHDFVPPLLGKPVDLSRYQHFGAWFERFKEMPAIKEWIKIRPVTTF